METVPTGGSPPSSNKDIELVTMDNVEVTGSKSLEEGDIPEKSQGGWMSKILKMTEAGDDNLNNSFTQSVVLLLNNMIGSGILEQAYVFAESGYILALFAYIVLGYFTYTGVILIAHAGHFREQHDFGDLARDALGSFGDHITNFSVFIALFTAFLSYEIFIMTLLQSVIETYTDNYPWYIHGGFLIAFITLIFILPTCMVRKFGYLTGISYISIVAISSIVFLVLVEGPIQSHKYDDERMVYADLQGFFNTIGSVVFAFSYSVGVFHVKPNMKDQSLEAFDKVAATTSSLGAIMCFLLGFVGYYSFRGETESDILLNFGGTLGAVFKIIVITHLIVYIPGDFVIMRHSLFALCGHDAATAPASIYYPATVAIIAVSAGLAILLQGLLGSSQAISAILNVAGGLGASATSFLIPGLVGLATFKGKDNNLYYQSYGIAVVGIIVPILVVASIAIDAAT